MMTAQQRLYVGATLTVLVVGVGLYAGGVFDHVGMLKRAAPGAPELVALESYAYWLASGAPLDPKIAGRGYAVFPALWGSDSFNWGAGMGRISNAAGFVKANMPLGLPGRISTPPEIRCTAARWRARCSVTAARRSLSSR